MKLDTSTARAFKEIYLRVPTENKALAKVGLAKVGVEFDDDQQAWGFHYKGPNVPGSPLFYYGKMNVLPYWNVQGGSVYMSRLFEYISGSVILNIEPNNASFLLTVTALEGAATFEFRDTDLSFANNNTMNLRDYSDTQILLTFDPPDGYLDTETLEPI